MDFVALAQECAPQVAHETMAALVRTETAFRPWSIGLNGGARLERQPGNKAEAVTTAQWLIAQGYSVDMGLAQINSANLAKLGLSVEDVFDPCKNLAAAAKILHGNYQAARRRGQDEQAALQAALSAYNTGSPTRGFANGYIQKVMDSAKGASTPKVAQQPQQAQAGPVAQPAAEGKDTRVYADGDISTRSMMIY